MSKLLKKMKETDSEREYNILHKTMRCYGDGENYLPDWSVAICCCPTHKRFWTVRQSKQIKKYWNRQRSWKKYRKTQYKTKD